MQTCLFLLVAPLHTDVFSIIPTSFTLFFIKYFAIVSLLSVRNLPNGEEQILCSVTNIEVFICYYLFTNNLPLYTYFVFRFRRKVGETLFKMAKKFRRHFKNSMLTFFSRQIEDTELLPFSDWLINKVLSKFFCAFLEKCYRTKDVEKNAFYPNVSSKDEPVL